MREGRRSARRWRKRWASNTTTATWSTRSSAKSTSTVRSSRRPTHTHASYEYQTKYGPRYANLTNRVISVQNEVIHRMAAQGPCVIIGRSANFLLEDRDDVLNLFIYAPKSIRVASIMEQFDAGQERAEEMVRYNDEINHARHKYITGTYRGDRNGRHMLLDSSLLGWDGTVRYLLALIEMLVEE